MTAPRHRWFRFAFSLRTLFVVVTACALWLGWQVRIVQERKAVLAELKRVDEQFWADTEFVRSDTPSLDYARISLLRRLLGDESCLRMFLPLSMGREWIARAEVAFPEAQLYVMRSADHPARYAYRPSLYDPKRWPNRGTLFKTGIPDPKAAAGYDPYLP